MTVRPSIPERHWDGKTVYTGIDAAGEEYDYLLPVPTQGSYWDGFRARLISGSSPETTVNPLVQLRDAPIDWGGTLYGTMQADDDGQGWWHFYLPEADTLALPAGLLMFDVDITNQAGRGVTVMTGTLLVRREYTRV